MKVTKVIWKHEGPGGPVWLSDGKVGNPYDGKLQNYKNAEKKVTGGYFAEWYTLAQAKKIAKKLGVPLETV